MIILSNNKGFKWQSQDGINVKGFFYDSTNKKDLSRVLQELKEKTTPESFIEYVKKQVGNFSIVVENEKYVMVAADFVRSIPIYYSLHKGEFMLSDDPETILDQMETREIDPISKSEFQLTTYVVGNNTLYKGLHSLDSGEILIFDKTTNLLDIVEYRAFDIEPKQIENIDETIERLHNLYLDTLRKVVDSVEGRPIVIPLSGGEDSRIVITMLHELGYKNVICFTYGIKGSKEAEVSRKVAEFYGYPWHVVEYNKDKWKSYFESEEYMNLAKELSGYISTPHIQDSIAVKELVENGTIPEDAVFVPGHTGDFIMGNLVPRIFTLGVNMKTKNVLEEIVNRYYSNFTWDQDAINHRDDILQHIDKTIGPVPNGKADQLLTYFDKFGWKEYHPKLIINSIRTYEHYNREWRMPLWDVELIDFWRTVPNTLRYKRNLHYTYACKKQKELREYLGVSNEYTMDIPKSLSKNDWIRLISPKLFASLRFNKTNKATIKNCFNHEFGWFNIISPEQLEKIKGSVTSVNSIVTYDYLNRIL